ncbi:hypothetical protein ACOMHN_036479 [Nucella lapillus]
MSVANSTWEHVTFPPKGNSKFYNKGVPTKAYAPAYYDPPAIGRRVYVVSKGGYGISACEIEVDAIPRYLLTLDSSCVKISETAVCLDDATCEDGLCKLIESAACNPGLDECQPGMACDARSKQCSE